MSDDAPSTGRPAPSGKRVTLRDVAARAGLTPSAVSLALRGDRSIPEATRQRVAEAAAALCYVPNAAARALRSRRHQTIGVLIFGPGDEDQLAFYGEVLLAVANQAIRHGCATLIRQVPEDTAADAAGIGALLASTPIDGAICLGGAGEVRETQMLALTEAKMPFVFVGRREAGGALVPHVATDYEAGSRLAIDHLVGLGHRRIALAADPHDRDLPYVRGRVQGYLDALRAHGLPVEPALNIEWPTPTDPAATTPASAPVEQLRDAGATAVFAVLYDTARRVLFDLHAAGLAVPGDVSVVGFSESAGAGSLLPPLTVIRQPFRQLGAAAAELLFEMLAGNDPAWPVTLPPSLVIRHSCGAAATRELDGLSLPRQLAPHYHQFEEGPQ